jgi:hypothetical protein
MSTHSAAAGTHRPAVTWAWHKSWASRACVLVRLRSVTHGPHAYPGAPGKMVGLTMGSSWLSFGSLAHVQVRGGLQQGPTLPRSHGAAQVHRCRSGPMAPPRFAAATQVPRRRRGRSNPPPPCLLCPPCSWLLQRGGIFWANRAACFLVSCWAPTRAALSRSTWTFAELTGDIYDFETS